MANKNTFKAEMLEKFNRYRKYCNRCENLRTEITVDQLPNEAKLLASFLEKDGILMYCKHCDEYGVLNPPETSLSF